MFIVPAVIAVFGGAALVAYTVGQAQAAKMATGLAGMASDLVGGSSAAGLASTSVEATSATVTESTTAFEVQVESLEGNAA